MEEHTFTKFTLFLSFTSHLDSSPYSLITEGHPVSKNQNSLKKSSCKLRSDTLIVVWAHNNNSYFQKVKLFWNVSKTILIHREGDPVSRTEPLLWMVVFWFVGELPCTRAEALCCSLPCIQTQLLQWHRRQDHCQDNDCKETKKITIIPF